MDRGLLADNLMLPLVALTGAEFVEALLRGGFRIVHRGCQLTTIARTGRTVHVAETVTLASDELLFLLRQAGVSYFDLLDFLAASKSKYAPRRASGFVTRRERHVHANEVARTSAAEAEAHWRATARAVRVSRDSE